MTYKAHSIEEYIEQLPEERKEVIVKLRTILQENLPEGFTEQINYGMPSFVVSHHTYPNGYHCDPKLPLPFINYASQKNFVALYHMGIYANKELMDWFVAEYPKHCKYKLDMGKSCIRFKKMNDIPYELIAELAQKMTPYDWIELYEENIMKTTKKAR
ncbi:uncharacterized protein YdhG (YjbR/CyaY superfamily) [Kordia periserrulae]|uniref:Uncharacterized protein YdhG (YjbR/CyaY superfamily) n=1 Tax=Kordia periserrulae TaxID=701523 RepID=A0A2T6C3R8_9FLAO|nr:DUF1801 domain-containing protein [Kordia periserrulae]PTX62907.1 uncharacterized protein YdhG (YjbR/CyaY superfamily) [Kordia periserrulae]